jgi:hypothetical protein
VSVTSIFTLALSAPTSLSWKFLPLNIEYLKGCSISMVDIANPTMKGENLKKALEQIYKHDGVDYEVSWVKAFNDAGAALNLITKLDVSKIKFLTRMCGNDPEAVGKVKEFAEDALPFNVKVLSRESYAKRMEENQSSIGSECVHSAISMVVIQAFWSTYMSLPSVFSGDSVFPRRTLLPLCKYCLTTCSI